jgi:hypothetical protein
MSSDDDKQQGFERRSRELLSESSEQLDAHIRSKLTQARFAAVEEARKRRGLGTWRIWMPLGGLTAAALAVLIWNGALQDPQVTQAQNPLDDLDIIAADENLEMMEEVEFYAWLDTEPSSEEVNGIG